VWIQDEEWQENTNSGLTIKDLEGQKCFVGLDLAKGSDLNAVCLIFPYIKEGVTACLWRFWISKDRINQKDMDFTHWVHTGEIKAVDAPVIPALLVASECLDFFSKYDVQLIGYDRFIATHGAITTFLDAGLNMMPFAQGAATLSLPTNEVWEMARRKELEHFDNPVIRWMVGNVVLSYDSNLNCKPDKLKSGRKIDGVMSLIFAKCAQLEYEHEKAEGLRTGTSIYEKKDMLMI
ncbi:MAG: hypothetical protein EOM23_07215, partial [Candidatus Moranbacteria bacterium]|nr:hypothetical protein [Candidatus Moranbacteria bacterium]